MSLVTLNKRIKFQEIVKNRESGTLKLLYETRMKGRLINDMITSIEEIQLDDLERDSFVLNTKKV